MVSLFTPGKGEHYSSASEQRDGQGKKNYTWQMFFSIKKKRKSIMAIHTGNSSSWEGEVRSCVWGQPGSAIGKILSQPGLPIKNLSLKKGWETCSRKPVSHDRTSAARLTSSRDRRAMWVIETVSTLSGRMKCCGIIPLYSENYVLLSLV